MPPKKAMICSDSERQMLVPDLIRLILDSLDFAAFHKARSISLDWYSTAELCIRQTPTPWLILFPNNNNGSCKLFDPCERKSYSVANLGFDFTRSRCLASDGSWFLMLDHRTNFHLLNLFTREMIPLPSLETIQGPHIRFERTSSGKLVFTKEPYINIKIAILWVDERSRDYFVVWNMGRIFEYHKKGDSSKSWKVFQPLKNRDYCDMGLKHFPPLKNCQDYCVDMVFKDHKLYMLCDNRKIDVFDFSCGDSPKECASFPTSNWYHSEYTENLAVTLAGEVFVHFK